MGRRRVPWLDRLVLAALAAVAVAVARPVFDPGYPSGWDAAGHFIRLRSLVEIFLPAARTDGWSPYWYNGFVPFTFYPHLFFLVVAAAHTALAGTVDLLGVFKGAIVACWALLPAAVYLLARAFRLGRFGALVGATASLGVSTPYGMGIEGLFLVGLVPHGFALLLWCAALGAFHVGITRGGAWVPLAGVACGLVGLAHTITTVHLALAGLLYVAMAVRAGRRPRRVLGRAVAIGVVALAVAAAALVPMLVYHDRLGPEAGWPRMEFLPRFLRGTYLGGVVVNGLALAFVVGLRRRRFETRYLLTMALLTLPLTLGLVKTGVARVDVAVDRLLHARSAPFVGVAVALFAGGACATVRTAAARRLGAAAGVLVAAGLVAAVAWDVRARLVALRPWIRVDSHVDTPEKRDLYAAFQWLRLNAPPAGLVGFDDRVPNPGPVGFARFPSRINLETERNTVQGEQLEATRAHNELPLHHLHDWEPEELRRRLLRTNVSHVLSWTDDVAANLGRGTALTPAFRSGRVTVWEVAAEDFRLATGDGVVVQGLDLAPERIEWTLAAEGPRTVTLAVAHHPSWRATLDGRPVPTIETEDHLTAVELPAGRSQLRLVFAPPWWESAVGWWSVAAVVAGLWGAHWRARA